MVVAFGCSFTFGDELDDLPKHKNFIPQDLWDNKKENQLKPSDKTIFFHRRKNLLLIFI